MGFAIFLLGRPQVYSDPMGPSAMHRQLILRLLPRLVDEYSHCERFAAAAKTCAAYRSGAEIVQTDRNPHMGCGDANAVGGIEANPAQVLDIGLRPRVAGLLRGDAVGTVEMSADVSRRDVERSRCRNKNMGEVLTDAASKRKSLGRGCGSMSGIGIEGDFAIECREKRVQ